MASATSGTIATIGELSSFVLPLLYRALARWQARHVDQEEETALGPEALGGEGMLAPT